MDERHEFLIHRISRLEGRIERQAACREPGDSIALLEELCSLIRHCFGEDHPSLLPRLSQLAALYRRSGDNAKAAATYRRIAALLQTCDGGDALRYAGVLNTVGVLYCETGQPQQALRFFERGLAIARRCLAGDDPNLANLFNNLASAHHSLTHLRRAEVHYREALAILERHPQQAEELGHCLCDLAELEEERKDRRAALRLAHRALQSFRRAAALAPSQLTDNVIRVANVYGRAGDVSTALRLLREVVERLREGGKTCSQELVRWIGFLAEADSGNSDLLWFEALR